MIGFPADAGCCSRTRRHFWFGVVDTVDPTSPQNFGVVEFTFDVSGFTDISVCIAMGAMGDWEVPGAHSCNDVRLDVLLQRRGLLPLFTSSVDEDARFNYTLASGKVSSAARSAVHGTADCCRSGFNIFSASAAGTRNTLTLRSLRLHGRRPGRLRVR